MGLYGDYVGLRFIEGIYRDYIGLGFIEGLYRDYIRIMEKNMETTMMGL